MTTEVADIGVATARTGIIGGGFMARVHAHAARSAGAPLVAIATSSPTSARRAAAELGFAHAADSAADLLRDRDVAVVHVCTPNTTHADLALAALEAGKHVVCEKPLATTVAQAELLARAAAESGLVAAVPFVYRYHPMVREARDRIAHGAVGTLLSLDCAYLQDWMLLPDDDDWRVDPDAGGPSRAFADIGSHLCDLVEFVTGERIARLVARTRTVFPERGGRPVQTEDIAALLVETESGALGTLLISQMAAGRKNALTLELHGSAESIRFAQENPEELWIGMREGSQSLLRDPATASGASARMQVLPAGHPLGYQDAFNAFVADVHAAVAGSVPEGMPTFADGLRAAQLTEAVLASAASGAWIEVPHE